MFDVTSEEARHAAWTDAGKVKALSAQDRDFLRPLAQAVLPELLEAEMTETWEERTPGRLG